MYKAWRVQEQAEKDQKYIVRIDFNDTEDHPGTCFYGPFSEEEAKDFSENFDEDDPELDDVMVIFLNYAILEEMD